MKKGIILNTSLILAIIISLFILLLFLMILPKKVNDYRCSQLPINEYYQDENCYIEKQ